MKKADSCRYARHRTGQGWEGWDAYAPFYDWENAQTLGRRDVPFWRRVTSQSAGRVLELGCGTGRILLPLAKTGVKLVGVDRSAAMLDGACRRLTAKGSRLTTPPGLVRADIRALPFGVGSFDTVIAPYGVLQSLLLDRDLAAALSSVARVLERGGRFGLELVPDVPKWREYSERVQLSGSAGRGVHLTLIESVQQHRKRRVTTFDQHYLERRNGQSVSHRFTLRFRTLPLPLMVRRLSRAGFEIDRVLGDYRGGPWNERADVWIILAKKR